MMKRLLPLMALTLLFGMLVACAPAQSTEPPAPSVMPVETPQPPSPTAAPAQPTGTQPPAPTATPTRLTLELAPEQPTKAVPAEEIYPMPDDATAVPPTDPYSLELIDKAKRDLAQRTGIPIEEINLVEFRFVTWPDASLGCPQPGMSYAQVLVDGYFIMLRAELGVYNYHGGGSPDRGPFLCEGVGRKIIVPPPAGSMDQ
jgi:hypothetical protein